MLIPNKTITSGNMLINSLFSNPTLKKCTFLLCKYFVFQLNFILRYRMITIQRPRPRERAQLQPYAVNHHNGARATSQL